VNPLKRVCVFCGSAAGVKPEYAEAARELGREVARRGIGLVYGGGAVGLMGIAADAALQAGAEVIGVIPYGLLKREVGHGGRRRDAHRRHMHERKAKMAELSDGFVVLPGGYGTLEEAVEALTWAQLGIQDKGVAFLDVEGFWGPFLDALDHMAAEGFIRPPHRPLAMRAADVGGALDALAATRRPPAPRLGCGRSRCDDTRHPSGLARGPGALRGATVALGNFDGVHLGHAAVLRAAHGARPDLPLAALTFEPHPREHFRPEDPPFRLTLLPAKAQALGALGATAVYALRFDAALAAMPAEAFVEEVLQRGIGALHLACGGDFAFGHRRGGDVGLPDRRGGAARHRPDGGAAGRPTRPGPSPPPASAACCRTAIRNAPPANSAATGRCGARCSMATASVVSSAGRPPTSCSDGTWSRRAASMPSPSRFPVAPRCPASPMSAAARRSAAIR
jgi:uncharacterized protein (TIGR00730 family)